MKQSCNFKRLALLGVCAATVGCASQGVLIGDAPSDPAPRIIFLGARDAQNNDYLTWENVSSFGKVPAELQAVGDLGCMRLGLSLRATGYHPRALDRTGKPMPGGGYFCQLSISSSLDASPPRIVNRNGVAGWDRPGAFGAIPGALAARAAQECASQGKNMKPLGYHPNAMDSTGKVLLEGGFLCVE